MAKQERKCPDCNGIQFVEDHANGDIVCKVTELLNSKCICPMQPDLKEVLDDRVVALWSKHTLLTRGRSGAPSVTR